MPLLHTCTRRPPVVSFPGGCLSCLALTLYTVDLAHPNPLNVALPACTPFSQARCAPCLVQPQRRAPIHFHPPLLRPDLQGPVFSFKIPAQLANLARENRLGQVTIGTVRQMVQSVHQYCLFEQALLQGAHAQLAQHPRWRSIRALSFPLVGDPSKLTVAGGGGDRTGRCRLPSGQRCWRPRVGEQRCSGRAPPFRTHHDRRLGAMIGVAAPASAWETFPPTSSSRSAVCEASLGGCRRNSALQVRN